MSNNGDRETPPMRENDRGETRDKEINLNFMNMAKHWKHQRCNLRRNNNKILSYSTPTSNTFNKELKSQAKQQGLNRTDICNLKNKFAKYDARELLCGPNTRTKVSTGQTSSRDDVRLAVPIAKNEGYGASYIAPRTNADASNLEAPSTNTKVLCKACNNRKIMPVTEEEYTDRQREYAAGATDDEDRQREYAAGANEGDQVKNTNSNAAHGYSARASTMVGRLVQASPLTILGKKMQKGPTYAGGPSQNVN